MDLITITITADSFLQKMVRNIVGVLVSISRYSDFVDDKSGGGGLIASKTDKKCINEQYLISSIADGIHDHNHIRQNNVEHHNIELLLPLTQDKNFKNGNLLKITNDKSDSFVVDRIRQAQIEVNRILNLRDRSKVGYRPAPAHGLYLINVEY